jgi:hypothetical protein
MSREKDETWRDLLRNEREVMTRRLEEMQKKNDFSTLQDMLEVKKHIEELNSKISASYNNTSSQEK